MEIIHLVVLLVSMKAAAAFTSNCNKVLRYHERYIYGYYIHCSRLNATSLQELHDIVVHSEISLAIEGSDLADLTPAVFENIPGIREASISRSALPEDAPVFREFRRLDVLQVTNCSLRRIGRRFSEGISALRVLNVSCNNVSGVEDGALALPRLEELDLSWNNLGHLPFPVCEAKGLRRLVLSHNRLSAVNSSITCLKLLEHLYLDFNGIATMSPLSGLSLVEINLSYNRLREATFGLKSLEELNLEGNELTHINSSQLNGSHSLKVVNLRNNLIRDIQDGAFAPSLEDLDLENNTLSRIPLLNLPNLNKLVLSNNTVAMKQELQRLSKLEVLILRYSGIETLPEHLFQNLTSLQVLDLSHNSLVFDSKPFFSLRNLEELYLQENRLEDLPDAAFQFQSKLEVLDLSANRLALLRELVFQNLSHLQVLNLSRNRLEAVQETVFRPMPYLRTLDLEGNRLRSIDYRWVAARAPFLEMLSIWENRFSCEFLQDMLRFFRAERINFTLNERLSFDVENVEGIPCHEVLQSLRGVFVAVALVMLALLATVAVVAYRIYAFVKNRGSISDEMELLDVRLRKWSNYL